MKTTLYIVNHSYKEKLLKETTTLSNQKYMSLEEFKKQYIFSYDDEAVYYLMRTRNIKYDIAKNLLKNMYLLWNTPSIENDKVCFLKEMEVELKEKNLLHENPLFKEYLKQVNIVVKGYILNKYDQKLLDSVKEITSITIENNDVHDYIPTVYEFTTIEEEIVFVASSIREQLKHIDISHIKVSISKEYEYLLELIFSMFSLPIHLKSSSILYGNTICKEWIKLLKEENDTEKVSTTLIEKYGHNPIIKELINITNTLPEEKVDDTYIEYFIYKCKTTNIPKSHIDGIECISFLDTELEETDFVYVLGCNMENMPTVYKDEDFLSDATKEQLEIDTSLDKNKIEKQKWLQKIQNTKNVIMTYKLKTPFDSYTKSIVLENFPIRNSKIDKYCYSNLYNQICLAKKIEKLIKYNEQDIDINKLYSKYPTISYRTYDNTFTGISSSEITSLLQNKVYLSYSSMNNYYLCGFKYYIANVLKLDIYEETFMTEIGNLYHYVLSKSVEESFDFETEYNNYIKEKTWSNKEKFFLHKLKDELRFVIETLSYQNRFTTLKETLCEEKLYTNPSSKIVFSGIIDKIMYKEEDNQKLVSIIDYKTGTPETNIMNIPYGLEMQLPVYVYLLKHNPKFRESKIVGFYLQKVLNKDFSYDGDDYICEKRKLLRLDGYSIQDETLLEQFDTTYKDSEFIRGMKIGKNGFYSYAKTITEEQIETMSKKVEEKIKEAADNIFNGNFPINPKRIGDDLVGCKYCKFKDICYKTEKDVVSLEKIDTLDFLGGDNDEQI